MGFVEYHGEKYMKVMVHSAIRPHGNDRLEVLTVDDNGTVLCKSRTVSPLLFDAVAGLYAKGTNGEA